MSVLERATPNHESRAPEDDTAPVLTGFDPPRTIARCLPNLLKEPKVFSHVFVSVNDFERALRFYGPVMESLGLELRFCEREKPWAGWHSAERSRPFFVICKPYDGQPQDPGNGQMTAFAATNRAMVQAAHRMALANGGTCEGPPGLRPQYHADYYGAYFRDPDGNKLCVACHAPAPEAS